jgi:hypothetical protein
MKRAHISDVLNVDLCDSQVGQIKNLGINDKNLEMIQP